MIPPSGLQRLVRDLDSIRQEVVSVLLTKMGHALRAKGKTSPLVVVVRAARCDKPQNIFMCLSCQVRSGDLEYCYKYKDETRPCRQLVLAVYFGPGGLRT